eukprot:CAMPEP_0194495734 /NCGR_PEP_ID=MMETSP0253-20130528/13235_1 /TAXON_ID=2966 /ORGANISM="Noctiluca scintillans" /LENGTH=57 /DNA_ID=CAMNT_0039337035 /DNA_START=50 /DNA_END=219 /DNA_ORIENTATION=-
MTAKETVHPPLTTAAVAWAVVVTSLVVATVRYPVVAAAIVVEGFNTATEYGSQNCVG